MRNAAAMLGAGMTGRIFGGRLSPAFSRRLARVGAAGFVFFLAKGLLWLLIPFLAMLLPGWFST